MVLCIMCVYSSLLLLGAIGEKALLYIPGSHQAAIGRIFAQCRIGKLCSSRIKATDHDQQADSDGLLNMEGAAVVVVVYIYIYIYIYTYIYTHTYIWLSVILWWLVYSGGGLAGPSRGCVALQACPYLTPQVSIFSQQPTN